MISNAMQRLRTLREDESALALIEFAFSAPIVLALGMLGAETANFTITHMQMSQIAMQVADNASRVGDSDVLVARQVFEGDINQTFIGAEKLGERYDVFENGRIILSSLQQNADGGQWIAWQRCRGAKEFDSSYGEEGDGEEGFDFPGMGETGREITAEAGTAVMFVEISYTYQSLTPFDTFDQSEMTYTAAFNIRDDRNLTGLFQTDPETPVADCGTYSADRPS